eukprot:PhF_6_TR22340/c0_g1_i2/m.31632
MKSGGTPPRITEYVPNHRPPSPTSAELELERLRGEVDVLRREVQNRSDLLRKTHTELHEMRSQLMSVERERDVLREEVKKAQISNRMDVDMARNELLQLRDEVASSLVTVQSLTADREMLASELLTLRRGEGSSTGSSEAVEAQLHMALQGKEKYKAKYLELKRRLVILSSLADTGRPSESRSRSTPNHRTTAAAPVQRQQHAAVGPNSNGNVISSSNSSNMKQINFRLPQDHFERSPSTGGTVGRANPSGGEAMLRLLPPEQHQQHQQFGAMNTPPPRRNKSPKTMQNKGVRGQGVSDVPL